METIVIHLDFLDKVGENRIVQKKLLVGLSVIVGILLLVAGGIYFVTPAHSLPAFFPGHDGTTTIHVKHGIGAVGLALAAFAYAWFGTGKKKNS